MLDLTRFRLLSQTNLYDCLTVGDFELICEIVEKRLLESLCLADAPTDDVLWDQLLSDAITVSIDVQTDTGVESESMRNYNYKMRGYVGSWERLQHKSGDLLGRFNACANQVGFQTDLSERIYGYF